MAWTVPRTYVTGEIVTAAILNVHVRDNLIDLDRRTSPVAALVNTFESGTSQVYANLATAGPAVTVTIGATGKALVSIHSQMANSTAGAESWAGFAITGATTLAASDERSMAFVSSTAGSFVRAGTTILAEGLVAGSTTFTWKYRVGSGTGTFGNRRIAVTPLGS